ncbi:MAG: class I SAM-dependent methyltransferase [Gemmatimonadota bacterium]|nr:class I SAM-dependent methyltransferase [Gemmatimonadota bacterium]
MNWLDRVHGGLVAPRRVRVLRDQIAAILPPGARVLDVGCGDGELAAAVASVRPDIDIRGIDVLVRRETRIPVAPFDGRNIPEPDSSLDVVLLLDVLHHAEDAPALLREAARVARAVIVKDHLREGWLAERTLRLMDWVGNARHGVRLSYSYWSEAEWEREFASTGLHVDWRRTALGLYPLPASWLFERGLHFMARLRPVGGGVLRTARDGE